MCDIIATLVQASEKPRAGMTARLQSFFQGWVRPFCASSPAEMQNFHLGGSGSGDGAEARAALRPDGIQLQKQQGVTFGERVVCLN